MSVDTKGCIVTDVKDVLLVCAIVERSLNRLIVEGRREAFPDKKGLQVYSAEVKETFREVQMELTGGASFVRFSFTYQGERRGINFHFDCDFDHKELGANSLSFSMGCWGSSELFAKTVLHALSMLGPVYLDRCDASSEGMVPLDAAPITLFEALAIGYVTAYQLERVLAKFDAGDLKLTGTFRQFAGVTRAVYTKLAALADCSERWNALEKLATETYPLPFAPGAGDRALAADVPPLLTA